MTPVRPLLGVGEAGRASRVCTDTDALASIGDRRPSRGLSWTEVNAVNPISYFQAKAYRYPHERLVLVVTLAAVLVVIGVTATATVCLSVLFVAAMLVISYGLNQSRHATLVSQGYRVTEASSPGLATLIRGAMRRLQVGGVEVFVVPARSLNAYTFGLVNPKVVVLQSPLLEVMDADELRFVVGHELGHVVLGHTWLNSLVGGMAGIPSPFGASVLLRFAFLWWNRTCEYSGDRAGLLACGRVEKAVSALVKLAAGGRIDTGARLDRVLRQIDAEDDHPLSGLSESLSTHPMTIRRIEHLRAYQRSREYQQLYAALETGRV
jgi:Zn-dependent protease with chaperone function